MSNYVSTYEITINKKHLDLFGHVNNAEYLKILEDARWDMLTRNQYGREMVEKTQKGPVILDLRLRFKKELLDGHSYKILTKPTKISEKILRIEHSILNSSTELCCTGEFTLGFLDLKSRKLVPMSSEWKSAVKI